MLSLTLVVLALAFSQDEFNVVNGLALPIAIVVANLSAIVFHFRASEYRQVHHSRAREILATHAPELQEINNQIPLPEQTRFSGRRRPLEAVHLTLCVLALVPLFAWIFA